MTKRNRNIAIRQGRAYWGAGPLPQGAELIGTVTVGDRGTGALIVLASGRMVMGNAGCITTFFPRSSDGAEAMEVK